MALPKYKDSEGNNKTAIQAIKEYFGSPGYPDVKMDELKPLMPSQKGPGLEELGRGAAKELGWTEVPPSE